jgi:hypothetical protein
MQGSEHARNSADTALRAAFRRFGRLVARGLSAPALWREPGRKRGAAGSSERINRPWLVLRRGPDRACPRRLRVRYERAGRSFTRQASLTEDRNRV